MTQTTINPTSSGQYATTIFEKYTAPEYRKIFGVNQYKPNQPIDMHIFSKMNRLNKFNVNDVTALVTNEKPTINEFGASQSKETLNPNFWGSRTGNSSEGIRAIAQNIKNKASALPRNELLAMKGYTPELNEQYGRLAQKMLPNQYFQGSEGGNYIAPQGMSQGVMKWLSKILPGANLISIPNAANLYNNIKQMGPQAGYLKWLGFDAPNPAERVY